MSQNVQCNCRDERKLDRKELNFQTGRKQIKLIVSVKKSMCEEMQGKVREVYQKKNHDAKEKSP